MVQEARRAESLSRTELEGIVTSLTVGRDQSKVLSLLLMHFRVRTFSRLFNEQLEEAARLLRIEIEGGRL